jgi:Flp pilus assembly CpaE family ATPase
VAAILAGRGSAAAATGDPATTVVLLDLARRNPTAGLRLGLAPPAGATEQLLVHPTGLLVGAAPASASPAGGAVAFPAALVDAAGADVVVLDFDCDLGEASHDVLARCDQILVTLTPTAGGVVDAYRSTALLRRLGLRERIGHVVNRWRPGLDLGEVMADLGAEVIAEIPDDLCFADSENRHRLAGLDGDGEIAAALERLATHIERRAREAPDAAVRSSRAG